MFRVNRYLAVLLSVQVLHVAGWGIYYALTRMIYARQEGFLLLLAAAETIPTITGIVGGILAERKGYKSVLLVGILEGLGLILAGTFVYNPKLLWLSVLFASIMWSMAGPQVYAYTLSLFNGETYKLGIVAAGSTIGYSVGSGFAPLLYKIVNSEPTLIVAGIMIVIAYIMIIVLLPDRKPKVLNNDRSSGLATYLCLIVIASLSFLVVEVIGSIYMGRLSVEVGLETYGLVNLTSGLIGALARPLAGKIIDSIGSRTSLLIILMAYSAYVHVLNASHGILFAVLWLIPLFPFLDLGLYKLASLMMGESRGTAIVAASYSVTGLVLLLMSVMSIDHYAIVVSVMATGASVLVALMPIARIPRTHVGYMSRTSLSRRKFK